MTVDEVRERVAKIAAIGGDDELAHGEEDLLHEEVLRAIADGRCPDPAGAAREALKTLDLDFERWCA